MKLFSTNVQTEILLVKDMTEIDKSVGGSISEKLLLLASAWLTAMLSGTQIFNNKHRRPCS